MNKKSIIFALDAILAILAVSSVIMASFFYLSKANISYGPQQLAKISADSLIVLEKSYSLSQDVENDNTANIQSYLNSLPNQICANITIYDQNSINQLYSIKSACTYSDQKTIARRSFIASFNSYYAEINSWYK